MNNLEKAKKLESDYLSQIHKLIIKHGSQNQLSIFLYGNENSLQSKLSRAKENSPLKLMTLYLILLDYKKAASFRLTLERSRRVS